MPVDYEVCGTLDGVLGYGVTRSSRPSRFCSSIAWPRYVARRRVTCPRSFLAASDDPNKHYIVLLVWRFVLMGWCWWWTYLKINDVMFDLLQFLQELINNLNLMLTRWVFPRSAEFHAIRYSVAICYAISESDVSHESKFLSRYLIAHTSNSAKLKQTANHPPGSPANRKPS